MEILLEIPARNFHVENVMGVPSTIGPAFSLNSPAVVFLNMFPGVPPKNLAGNSPEFFFL